MTESAEKPDKPRMIADLTDNRVEVSIIGESTVIGEEHMRLQDIPSETERVITAVRNADVVVVEFDPRKGVYNQITGKDSYMQIAINEARNAGKDVVIMDNEYENEWEIVFQAELGIERGDFEALKAFEIVNTRLVLSTWPEVDLAQTREGAANTLCREIPDMSPGRARELVTLALNAWVAWELIGGQEESMQIGSSSMSLFGSARDVLYQRDAISRTKQAERTVYVYGKAHSGIVARALETREITTPDLPQESAIVKGFEQRLRSLPINRNLVTEGEDIPTFTF